MSTISMSTISGMLENYMSTISMSTISGMLEALVSCLKTYAVHLQTCQESSAEIDAEQQKFGEVSFVATIEFQFPGNTDFLGEGAIPLSSIKDTNNFY
jgi:hypothetical protein